ncbi:MAG: hypothetical protein HZA90_01540 [Verrucomicrobia bacterium]|nr:hypothetical protein [Verrucomicrobiota bacterium]
MKLELEIGNWKLKIADWPRAWLLRRLGASRQFAFTNFHFSILNSLSV